MVTHKYTNLTNSIMHELCRGKKKKEEREGGKGKEKSEEMWSTEHRKRE